MNYLQLWRSSGLVFPLLLAVAATPVLASGHTVRNGETLTSIAKKYQVPVSALQKANPGINPGQIAKGQVLQLPGPGQTAGKTTAVAGKLAGKSTNPKAGSAAPSLAAAPQASRRPAAAADQLAALPAPKRPAKKGITTYKIRSGDTLVALARRHGVSVADLVEMNGLESTELQANQNLILPTTGAAATAPAPAPAPAPVRPTTVDQENTVDLTPPARRNSNGDTPARRSAPPVNPPAAQGTYYHVVKNGETFSSIARDRGVPVEALVRANRSVDPKKLSVNQRLNIPGVQVASRTPDSPTIDEMAPAPVRTAYHPEAGTEETPASPAPVVEDPLTSNAGYSRLSYRVSEKDSMDSIAREFGTSPKALRQLNQMGPFDRLTAGSFISVPWAHTSAAE